MSWYVTPEQYQQAQANGINPERLTERVRRLGWPIEKAITQPIQAQRTHGSLSEWVKIAEQNGICRKTFYDRINQMGWTEEKASTQPVSDRRELLARNREKQRKIPKCYHDLAKKNGIKRTTFINRVRQHGWSFEMAAITPVITRSEAGKKGGMVNAEKTFAGRNQEFERGRVCVSAGSGEG